MIRANGRPARDVVATLEPWVRAHASRAGAGGPAVAVVLGSSVNALSFARSLGRRGVPVLVLDADAMPAMYSRYARAALLPPPVGEARDGYWLDVLRGVGALLPRPGVLLPTTDPHVLLMARYAGALAAHYRFVVPPAETVERVVDKRLQYTAAREAGIPLPPVHFPESPDDVRAVAGTLAYPCILKPYASHAARARMRAKVVVAESADQLVDAYRALAAPELPLMIQEVVPGGDDALFGYLAFWDERGRERAWVTKRKLRQFPVGFGDGSLQVTVEAPEVAALSRRLLRAFGWRGFVGVEFKRDARDGTFRLMEINPRTVSGNQLAVSAGVDFPWLTYRHLTEPASTSAWPTGFRSGVTLVNEEWDLQAFLALRRAGRLTFADWLRSVGDADARALAAWDDPMPLLDGVRRMVAKQLVPRAS